MRRESVTGNAFMLSLSNHEGIAPAILRRFMVRPFDKLRAHHEVPLGSGSQIEHDHVERR